MKKVTAKDINTLWDKPIKLSIFLN